MCGIAGYSLSSRSAVHRTLAAQSLLAGIAERGADAVGYAYRSPEDAYPVVTKQRTPASELLERISVPQTATELLVHVRDYGPGVPPDLTERLFDPYVTGKSGGTGLGLALAKQTVEMHRGAISIEPTPGGGATFVVRMRGV